MQSSDYLVTALVSTYNSERFMQGCLESLTNQTIGKKLEILVIDSGSQQNEGAIVAEFQKIYPNIRYFRTVRENLYQAWNRGVALASGKFLTSANTDDRHRPDAYEIMADILSTDPKLVLVYADQKRSVKENESFFECSSPRMICPPDYSTSQLLVNCVAGSQPMWRASAHNIVGKFDESYIVAGDYDMWLRMARHWDFYHIREVLGLRLISPTSIEHANEYQCDMEMMSTRLTHLSALARGDELIQKELALTTYGVGYRYIRRGDPERAEQFIRESIKLDPFNFGFYKTYVLRLLLGLRMEQEPV